MCAVVAPPANMPLPCGCVTKGRGLWKVTSAQTAGLTQHIVLEIAGDVLKSLFNPNLSHLLHILLWSYTVRVCAYVVMF